MLRKIFVLLLSSSISLIVMAEPDIEVVSQIPSGTDFVMQSPSTDCRYDLDHATEVKSIDGGYSLTRKPNEQRIHQYSCQLRIDNTKTLSEIAFWGMETVTSLVHYAQCDLYIVTNTEIYMYDMTPVFVLGSNTITQYKVTGLNNMPSNTWIYRAGFMCTATENTSGITINAIGVKYQ